MTSAVFSRADVRYEVLVADITTLSVDAVVTAANARLAGGGGVDGAIHRAAGPGLLADCRALGGCPTGEARLTAGHDLAARFVIHAVGPVWQGGERGEPALLASAYRAAVELARRHGVASLAFPSISTGIYGFPGRAAAEIAVAAVLEATIAPPPAHIVFCCFSPDAAAWHRDALKRTIPS